VVVVTVVVAVRVTVARLGAGGAATDGVGLGAGVGVGVGLADVEAVGLDDGAVYRLLRSHPASMATSPATATTKNIRASIPVQRAVGPDGAESHPAR
jgi:hypothetical protein